MQGRSPQTARALLPFLSSVTLICWNGWTAPQLYSTTHVLSAARLFYGPLLQLDEMKEPEKKPTGNMFRSTDKACHIKLYTLYTHPHMLTHTHTLLLLYKSKENPLKGLADAVWSFSTLWSLIERPPWMVLVYWTNTAASWRINCWTCSEYKACEHL